MNILGDDDKSKRSSLIIVAAFGLALIAVGLLIQLAVGGAAYAMGITSSLFGFYPPAAALMIIIWLTIFAGSYFMWRDMRGGGAVVARRLGAIQASNRSRHPGENVLLEVVAEMAVASRCKRPEVFVLRDERSSNTMVVGSLSGDNAIVVTDGALARFSRDELQGVIAHEFAHIANNDVPTNMRLMMALGGLLALDEVGTLLCNSDNRKRFHLMKVVGFFLRILGSIGVLAGSLLRAVFSRQPVLLADAAAVQYQRQKFPLASALYKIRRSTDNDVALHTHFVNEVRHLCLHAGNRESKWDRFNSSHPSLTDRINAIDPHIERKIRRESAQPTPVKAAPLTNVGNGSEANAVGRGFAPTFSFSSESTDESLVAGTAMSNTDEEAVSFSLYGCNVCVIFTH